MKKRLIAIVLSVSVFSGVSVVAYASSGEANICGQATECKVSSDRNENCRQLKEEGVIPYMLNGGTPHILSNIKYFITRDCYENNIVKSEEDKKILEKKASDKAIEKNKAVEEEGISKVNKSEISSTEKEKSDGSNNVVKKENAKKNNTNSKDKVKSSKDSNSVGNKNESTIDKNNSNNEINNNSNNEISNNNFMAEVESLIFKKVNNERQKAGVAPLKYSKTMEKYGRIKSKDMGDNGYFDHRDLSGNLITEKMKVDGVRYNAWGENIAYISGVNDANALANQFMTNWMNSQGHRENILSSKYSEIGVGVYKIGNKVYATQEFYR